jgi:1,4-alpha-glucan branching enzyme
MIYKTQSPFPHHIRVTFELPAWVWADQVCVVGDFNQWRANATLMRQERDGNWRATVDLPRGRCYEFCYLVDSEWRTDLQADSCPVHLCRTNRCVVIATQSGRCPAAP